MWQRKQTLFLALAALLAAAMYLLPLAAYTRLGSGDVVTLRLNGLFGADGRTLEPGPSIPLHWLNALLIAQLVVTLALFNHRGRQRRIARLAFLFALGMIVGFVFTHNAVSSAMGTVASVKATLLPAAYFPLAVLVLVLLADRGIRQDEALVRSVDRLR